MELKRIEEGQTSFTGISGKKYTIYDTLPIARFQHLEVLQISVLYGRGAQVLFDNLKKAWEMLDKSKPASAAVELYNLMQSTAEIADKRQHPLLLISTLFICEEGEDLTKWNEQDAEAKIKDWGNIDIAAFFLLSISTLSAFHHVLLGSSLLSSQQQENQ